MHHDSLWYKLHFYYSSGARPQLLSHVTLFVTPWTVVCQAPLSMAFSRQEYWSGLPFPAPGDIPDPGIKHSSALSPDLAGGFFITVPPGKPIAVVGGQCLLSLSMAKWLWWYIQNTFYIHDNNWWWLRTNKGLVLKYTITFNRHNIPRK